VLVAVQHQIKVPKAQLAQQRPGIAQNQEGFEIRETLDRVRIRDRDDMVMNQCNARHEIQKRSRVIRYAPLQ
jgi:hypothetical protein